MKQAAAAFSAKHPKLEYLILNAAVMATPFKLTEDGFEEQMAATHFGHFTLTASLIDKCEGGLLQPRLRLTRVTLACARAG